MYEAQKYRNTLQGDFENYICLFAITRSRKYYTALVTLKISLTSFHFRINKEKAKINISRFSLWAATWSLLFGVFLRNTLKNKYK